MLRFGKLYIHFLTPALFVIFILNGHAAQLCCAYLSMLLHETAHLCAALYLGLRISYFALYPFGVNLKLKNKMVASMSDAMILYLSGPAVNIIIAFTARIIGSTFLYRMNIMLFVMNILPVMPLDGGCLMKKQLSGKLGTDRAVYIMRVISVFIALVMAAAGGYAIYKTGYNYSMLMLAVFMLGNLFTQKEKYNVNYLTELMFYRNKPLKKAKLIAVDEGADDRDTVKHFLPGRYGIVCRIDKNGKICGFSSEREIIERVLETKK